MKKIIDITQLLIQVNTMYQNGFTSLAKIEKELGYGKDSIRQRLSRNGYVFNKQLKQYVLEDNTTITQVTELNNTTDNTLCYRNNEDTYNPIENNIGGAKKMTLKEFKELRTIEQIEYINKFTDGKKTLKDIEKEHFTFTNIGKYIDRAEGYWDGDIKRYIHIEPKEEKIFTEEEILFIKNLYKQHTITQDVTQKESEHEELITRSVRVDKKTIDTFAKYCKDNNIKQSTALKIALENFMKQ